MTVYDQCKQFFLQDILVYVIKQEFVFNKRFFNRPVGIIFRMLKIVSHLFETREKFGTK